MDDGLSRSAARVQAALAERGATATVVELPDSTRTAKEAARAVGCEVAQIAKSLVFRGERTGEPVLVVASGTNRVDGAKVAGLVGEPIGKADADFVREHTGFVIGGVPPLGHPNPIRTVLDRDLLALGRIWAAAGTPRAVFEVAAAELPALTGATVGDVRQESGGT